MKVYLKKCLIYLLKRILTGYYVSSCKKIILHGKECWRIICLGIIKLFLPLTWNANYPDDRFTSSYKSCMTPQKSDTCYFRNNYIRIVGNSPTFSIFNLLITVDDFKALKLKTESRHLKHKICLFLT